MRACVDAVRATAEYAQYQISAQLAVVRRHAPPRIGLPVPGPLVPPALTCDVLGARLADLRVLPISPGAETQPWAPAGMKNHRLASAMT